MRFLPELGYETALRILASHGLPIRERSGQNVAPLSSQSRNLMYSSSPRTTTAFGASLVPILAGTSQSEQRSASSIFSRHRSSVQDYLTSPSMVSSDPSSVFAEPRPGIHTSHGRLESHVPPASGYGPYRAHLEPTRHPQYNPINLAQPTTTDRMDAETARPFTAPVRSTSMATGTLSQLLPPKRELPFVKLASKPVRQDMSAPRGAISVPESGNSNGEENALPLKSAPPRKKGPERKEATPKNVGRPNLTATPKKKPVSKRKVTPKKKATPKKKTAPRKKATPRKEAPSKSKSGISDGKKTASNAPESSTPTRLMDATTACRTGSVVESAPLPDDGPVTPSISTLISVEWINKVNAFMEEVNGCFGQDKLTSESPLVTAEWMNQVNQFIEKGHLERAKIASEPPLIGAEWISQVNEFMKKGHLDQAKKAAETPLISAGWISQVNQFMENGRYEQAKMASETPWMSAEWISQVNEFIDEGKGHFANVEIWSHSPLITADWVNRVDDVITRHTELSGHVKNLSKLVNHLLNQNHTLVEFISNFMKGHTTCHTLFSESGNLPSSATSRLRTPEPQRISQVKRLSKRRLGPEYGLTPSERPSKRGRVPRRRLGSGYGL